MRTMVGAAKSPEDILTVRRLFLEYIAWLGLDLSFQNVDREFADFPGRYAPPGGQLFLARREDGLPVGCMGVRPLSAAGSCEMKRVYVVEAARGPGTRPAQVAPRIRFAESAGYREIFADTLPQFAASQAILRGTGFEAIPPYYDNPVPGALFFRKTLNVGSDGIGPGQFPGE